MSATTTGGLTVNNSGRILGNILFGSAGNGDTLNVGNTAGGGIRRQSRRPVWSTRPRSTRLSRRAIVSDTVGLAPLTEATTISFGSGTGNLLHVGGYGYVNAVITSAAGGLAVQVDPNGQLFVANTTTALQASTFNIANNGTLGLAISQTNLNSLTPVVQANSATLDRRQPVAAVRYLYFLGLQRRQHAKSHRPDHHPGPGPGDHRQRRVAGRPERGAGPEHAVPVRDAHRKRSSRR